MASPPFDCLDLHLLGELLYDLLAPSLSTSDRVTLPRALWYLLSCTTPIITRSSSYPKLGRSPLMEASAGALLTVCESPATLPFQADRRLANGGLSISNSIDEIGGN